MPSVYFDIVVAQARRIAQLSRHKEVHPGHLFLAFMKRPRFDRTVRALSVRRNIVGLIEAYLGKRPREKKMSEALPELSDNTQAILDQAEALHFELFGQANGATENDLFVALIRSNDPIVHRALRQHEVDQEALLTKFTPARVDS